MQVLQKFYTLMRGGARESAQIILDANALRIFEQEIIDVEQMVHARKQAMAEVIAARKQLEREIASVEHLIEKREQQAQQLLERHEEDDMLTAIATELVDLEQSKRNLDTQHKALCVRIEKMKSYIQKALQDVMRYRRDLRLARAQQISSSHLAQKTNLPAVLSELESTRDHVFSLQGEQDDRDEAWLEMEENLTASPIDVLAQQEKQHKIDSVLARLRTPDNTTE